MATSDTLTLGRIEQKVDSLQAFQTALGIDKAPHPRNLIREELKAEKIDE